MSTGLLLFLIFMALSIIDSVARARRGQQRKALPSEDEGDEERRAEPSPAQTKKGEAGRREPGGQPGEALGELLGLEKLMGPGYLEKLMGPGIAGVVREDDSPEESAEAPPPPDERRRPSAGRDERRVIARERRTSDQERRRSEAGRRARVERAPDAAEGRWARVEQGSLGRDRPPSKRDESGGRPARAPREAAPPRDSAAGERRRLELTAAAPGVGRAGRRRTRMYRELFGGGGRDSLRRAFVLKEILDVPASDRPPDRRETG